MNPLQVGAAVGLLTSGGLWCAAQSVRRAPRSLAAARQLLHGRRPSTTGAASTSTLATRRDQLVNTLAEGEAGRWVARRFGDELELVGLSPVDVISRVLAVSGVTLFTALGAVSASTFSGVLPVSLLSPVAALTIAALAGCLVVYHVASTVDRGRRELRRVAADFVQLVAVGVTADQSVEEAVRFALEVGRSDAFDSLRAALYAAPQRGVAVWDALDEFGARYGIRELTELASSVERQSTQGVSIRDTVDALAASMRATALDELEREADRANANLSGPTVGFVVATIVFLAYPLVQRINEAFGG